MQATFSSNANRRNLDTIYNGINKFVVYGKDLLVMGLLS